MRSRLPAVVLGLALCACGSTTTVRSSASSSATAGSAPDVTSGATTAVATRPDGSPAPSAGSSPVAATAASTVAATSGGVPAPTDPPVVTAGMSASSVPGTWKAAGPLTISGARTTADRSIVDVWFTGSDPSAVEGDGCWEGYAGSASDATGRMVVSVTRYTSTIEATGGCKALGYGRSLTIQLPKPLGENPVIVDGSTNEPITVLDVAIPEATWLPDGWSVDGRTDFGGTRVYGIPKEIGRSGGHFVTVAVQSIEDAEYLRGATTLQSPVVQGRPAIIIGRDGGTHALVMQDAHWILTIDGGSASVDDGTLVRIAEGLRPLPFSGQATANTVPPRLSGSIASLIGKDGPADVTGWLVIDATGKGAICDQLAATSPPACADPQLEVEWIPGGDPPPASLQHVGDLQVSAAPVTLSGNLKGDILYPGIF